MHRSSLLVAATAAIGLSLLGCDNDRDAQSSPPAPSPEAMKDMAFEGAIKDKPGESTGIPATTQSTKRPPGKSATDDVRNAVEPDDSDSPDAPGG